jgi:hypothetical protein
MTPQFYLVYGHCHVTLRLGVIHARHDTTFSSPNLAALEEGYISIGNRRQIEENTVGRVRSLGNRGWFRGI